MFALTALSASAIAVCVATAGAGVDGSTEREATSSDSQQVVSGEVWTVRGGTTTIALDASASAQWGLRLGAAEGESPDARGLAIMRDSTFVFSVLDGSVGEVRGGELVHLGDLEIGRGDASYVLADLVIATTGGTPIGSPWIAGSGAGAPGLMLDRVKAGFDRSSKSLTVRSDELRMSAALARELGAPELARMVIGTVTIRASAMQIGGERSARATDDRSIPPAMPVLVDGPDMTFCQLYGIRHLSGSRLGDIVGLSVATTSGWSRSGSPASSTASTPWPATSAVVRRAPSSRATVPATGSAPAAPTPTAPS
jgi:hypothetical protein